MKVLIIDNNVMEQCWGARDLVRMIPSGAGASIHVRRGPHGDFPPDATRYDRIVISGSLTRVDDVSPWTFELEKLIRRAGGHGTPLLGICFGHQMIARAFGGMSHVGLSAVPEHGWTKITVRDATNVLKGLPRNFYSFSAHYDEVSRLPPDFEGMASSEACRLQAMKLRSKPVYGIQFHPEKTAQEGRETYLEQKQKGEGRAFLNPGEGRKLHDPAVGETIFRNFIMGAAQ